MVCYQRFHMPGFPLISWRWASTLKSIGFPVGLEAASMEYSFISALKELNRNIFHYIIPLPVFDLKGMPLEAASGLVFDFISNPVRSLC